jgi:hypothetical protein
MNKYAKWALYAAAGLALVVWYQRQMGIAPQSIFDSNP